MVPTAELRLVVLLGLLVRLVAVDETERVALLLLVLAVVLRVPELTLRELLVGLTALAERDDLEVTAPTVALRVLVLTLLSARVPP